MTDLRTLPEDARIIIPLRDAVLFPGVLTPVTVSRQISVAAAQEAVKAERPVGFLLQRDPQKDEVRPDDLYWVGTQGPIARYITGQDGAHHLLVQGQSRFRVLEFLEGWPFMVARVALVEDAGQTDSEIEARFLQLKQQTLEPSRCCPMCRTSWAPWCKA